MGMSAWVRWAVVLGVALGGFFDGILLHQILQWHHLLSQVSSAGDLRMQVMWDGYFHALMYAIAALGLWGLWRARAHMAGQGWGRLLAGSLLVGFGLWHGLDAVLSHWLLGIHRVRDVSDMPLVWDLIWFGAFGLVPLAIGWWLLRRPGGGPMRVGTVTAALVVLSATTIGAGIWALQSPTDQPFTTVVFRPGLAPADVVAALAATESRLVWADPAMSVLVVEAAPERRWDFFWHGAMLVSGAGMPTGCFEWSRI